VSLKNLSITFWIADSLARPDHIEEDSDNQRKGEFTSTGKICFVKIGFKVFLDIRSGRRLDMKSNIFLEVKF